MKFNQTKKRCIGILLGTVILSILVFLIDAGEGLPHNKSGEQVLYRNGYGQGDKEEQLKARVEDKENQEVTVTVEEQEYSESETQKVLQEAGSQLEKYILGENESLDVVRSDLNLITKIPNTSIEVSWETSDYGLINAQGVIKRENLQAGGSVVVLKALLTYQKTQVEEELPVCLYPPLLSDQEAMKQSLESAVGQKESEDRSKKEVKLPKEVNGNAVYWSQEKRQRGLVVLLFGVVICGLSVLVEKEKKKEQQKKKQNQMVLDYPDIINQFTVLLSAGLTAKNAWMRMVQDYKKKQNGKTTRFAYEEMAYTMREMNSGRTEGECYERFGARINLPEYMKFGAMLSQNLKKGSKGLAELLKREAEHAFEERKNQAKKLGEEASTKLLMPMILMLLVVFTIIIVPAFLSIQL